MSNEHGFVGTRTLCALGLAVVALAGCGGDDGGSGGAGGGGGTGGGEVLPDGGPGGTTGGGLVGGTVGGGEGGNVGGTVGGGEGGNVGGTVGGGEGGNVGGGEGGNVGGAIVPPPECAGAEDFVAAAVQNPDGSWTVSGDTSNAENARTGDCGGDTAPDVTYAFTAPEAGFWSFSTTPVTPEFETFDTVIYGRVDCEAAESELACNDDDQSIGPSAFELELAAGQTIFVTVDGYDEASFGTFELTASAVVRNPPALDSAQVFIGSEPGTLGFRVSGTDADNNVERLSLQLFDLDGQPIDVAGNGGDPVEVLFGNLQQADGEFVGTASFVIPLPEVSRVQVSVVDATDLASDVFEVVPVAPPAVAAGATCDPLRALDRCEATCDVGDDGAALCGPTVAICPDLFGETVLPAAAEGPSSIESVLGPGASIADGTCTGQGADIAYTFTAPGAGLYKFEVTSEDESVSASVFVRRDCGVEDVRSELGCGFLSTIVELEAGETVYPFVTGEGNFFDPTPWEGAFTLTASRISAPTIGFAETFVNVAEDRVGFVISGGDADANVVTFGVRLLDEGGNDLLDPNGDFVFFGDLPSPLLNQDGPEYLFYLGAALPDEVFAADVAEIEVIVRDADGLLSESVTVVPAPTGIADEGETCDIGRGVNVCAEGTACYDANVDDAELAVCTQENLLEVGDDCDAENPLDVCPAEAPCFVANPDDGSAGVCTVIVAECPAEFGEVADLNAAAVGDGLWSFEGDTTTGFGLSSASDACFNAGDDPESLAIAHAFVAPATGVYGFQTDTEFDSVLYVRTSCGFINTELACNDDDRRGDFTTTSYIEAELVQGETYFVFVDGYNADDFGPYTLIATLL
jgi:hypothetical protein